MELTVSGRSDIGHRATNEDLIDWWLDLGLFVVADGMGGHQGGEVASRLAVDAIHAFVADSMATPDMTWPFGVDPGRSLDENRLRTAVRLASRRVFAEASSHAELGGMGTTVVAALVRDGKVSLVSVGDSRVYRWRDRTLTQLTEDDTWIASVLGREAARDAEMTHPLRHVLTNVVGTSEDVTATTREERLQTGDLLVLCTDGVHGRLDLAALTGVMEDTGGEGEVAAELVNAAVARGTSDNASALVIRVT